MVWLVCVCVCVCFHCLLFMTPLHAWRPLVCDPRCVLQGLALEYEEAMTRETEPGVFYNLGAHCMWIGAWCWW